MDDNKKLIQEARIVLLIKIMEGLGLKQEDGTYKYDSSINTPENIKKMEGYMGEIINLFPLSNSKRITESTINMVTAVLRNLLKYTTENVIVKKRNVGVKVEGKITSKMESTIIIKK